MHAVTIREPGGPDVLTWEQVAESDPEPGPGEVLVDVAATAVNRADLLQRQGNYPVPPGAPEWPGLECSGTVAAVGPGVETLSVGDEVCALLAGGGYAEKVVVPEGQAMPVPSGVELREAAALPEVACTVWSNVFMLAELEAGESLLVHGGGGGIGTFAIQLASAMNARVLTTAGSKDKLDRCRELGADVTINYKDEDFVARVKEETDNRGVDVILDNIGAKYLAQNLNALATSGRLVVIGLQGGRKAELDLGKMLTKRLSLLATTLRSRPTDEKASICASVVENVWPLVESGAVRPVIDRVLPIADAAEGHRALEESSQFGKVVLEVR
ncbi:MAG: NAD(P)H-quinone oxidoreductase [Actinomycetes bacterium]